METHQFITDFGNLGSIEYFSFSVIILGIKNLYLSNTVCRRVAGGKDISQNQTILGRFLIKKHPFITGFENLGLVR